MRTQKIEHLAELYSQSDRMLEYKFFDMKFEIIVDLPLDIEGLTPYLFCPEIIFTLFLHDNAENLYQCDASEISSNNITLCCKRLEEKPTVSCTNRHEKIKPEFLKQSPQASVTSTDSVLYHLQKLTQIILNIFTFILITYLIFNYVFTRKQENLFQHNRENLSMIQTNQNDVPLTQITNVGKTEAEKDSKNFINQEIQKHMDEIEKLRAEMQQKREEQKELRAKIAEMEKLRLQHEIEILKAEVQQERILRQEIEKYRVKMQQEFEEQFKLKIHAMNMENAQKLKKRKKFFRFNL